MGLVEVDNRFFIHAELHEPTKPSVIKHYLWVLSELEQALKDKGLDKYYTLADSVDTFNYNKLMGFRTNLEVWNDEYEVMVKDI